MGSSRHRRVKVRASGATSEDEGGERLVVVSGAGSSSSNSVSSSTITNCILLFMLFLVFLCMVALAVALCRVGRIEKSLDMMTLMQASNPSGKGSAPSTVSLAGGYSVAPPANYYYPPPPLMQPIQLPIPPPRSYM